MKEKQIRTHSHKLLGLVFTLAVINQLLVSTSYGQFVNPCYTAPSYRSTTNCVMVGPGPVYVRKCYYQTSLGLTRFDGHLVGVVHICF